MELLGIKLDLSSIKKILESLEPTMSETSSRLTDIEALILDVDEAVIDLATEIDQQSGVLESILDTEKKARLSDKVTTLRIGYLRGDAPIVESLSAEKEILDAILVDATIKNRVDEAKFFLAQCADVNNVVGGRGLSLLAYAALHNHTDLMQLLLDKGARVELGVKATDETPLHFAAAVGQVEASRLLIKQGANVNSKDRDGETPLMKAVSNSSPEVIGTLLENGADVNASDGNGATALMLAAGKCEAEIVALLLAEGAAVHARDQHGETALCWTIMSLERALESSTAMTDRVKHYLSRAQLCIVQSLISHGSDVNATDRAGVSILRRAMNSDRVEVVKALLEAGAIDGGSPSDSEAGSPQQSAWTPRYAQPQSFPQ